MFLTVPCLYIPLFLSRQPGNGEICTSILMAPYTRVLLCSAIASLASGIWTGISFAFLGVFCFAWTKGNRLARGDDESLSMGHFLVAWLF